MSEAQTTAQRIQKDINFYYGYGPTAPRLSPLSERIAAEIDALTQTNALMLDSAERGQATVAELRAEVATLTAELLQKEQQLAAARDTIAANNAKSEAWEAEAEAQLAEARAEVERLTPGHDAWQYRQACEAWDAGEISAIQFADAYEKYDPRGRERRARAAAKAETL